MLPSCRIPTQFRWPPLRDPPRNPVQCPRWPPEGTRELQAAGCPGWLVGGTGAWSPAFCPIFHPKHADGRKAGYGESNQPTGSASNGRKGVGHGGRAPPTPWNPGPTPTDTHHAQLPPSCPPWRWELRGRRPTASSEARLPPLPSSSPVASRLWLAISQMRKLRLETDC